MTSLLQHHFRGTDAEALSYLEDVGWTSRMTTASPGVHVLGGAVFLALGAVAGTTIARDSLPGGIAAALAGAALALLDLLPAFWTLTHREYTTQYLAARSFFGGRRPRLHPLLVLVGLPVMSFVAAAFAPAHASAAVRLLWGLLGAAIGASFGLLRVARARRSVHLSR
jgi:hypothetical protein